MTPTPKTVLYVRVSTAEQTSEHQIDQAVNEGLINRDDMAIVDHGVSGVSTKLIERDQGKRLFDILQAGDTLVVRWVDRLGRNYDDVSEVIRHFMKHGVTVKTVTNRMVFQAGATDPILKATRDAIISFMAAMGEAEATAKREACDAGIALAKAGPDAERKYRGRKPAYNRQTFDMVQDMIGKQLGTSVTAREAGLSRQTVLRIKAGPASCEAALTRWGM